MPSENGNHWGLVCLLLASFVIAGCRTGRNYPDPARPRYGDTAHVSSRANGDTLRIVSFNIEFARRVDSAIALLQSDTTLRGADLLLLQEMDAPSTQRVAEALGMAYVYHPAIHQQASAQRFRQCNPFAVANRRRREAHPAASVAATVSRSPDCART